MNVDEAVRSLWGPRVNSTNRLERLLDAVATFKAPDFWAAFQQGWPLCDDTWDMQQRLIQTLRRQGRAAQFLAGADLVFFEALPETVVVYRGSSPVRRLAASWTTDPDVAAVFARGHRGIPVPDGKVHQASLSRAKIYSVITSRDEREIILDPTELSDIRVSRLDEAVI